MLISIPDKHIIEVTSKNLEWLVNAINSYLNTSIDIDPFKWFGTTGGLAIWNKLYMFRWHTGAVCTNVIEIGQFVVFHKGGIHIFNSKDECFAFVNTKESELV